jgi:hypothetical protein
MSKKYIIQILLLLLGGIPGFILIICEFIYWFKNPNFTQMEIFQKFFGWTIGVVLVSITCYFLSVHINKTSK